MGFKTDLGDATIELLSKLDNLDEKGVCFIIYGQMVSQEKVEEIIAKINEKYPTLEVGAINGKQDVYDLLIGLM